MNDEPQIADVLTGLLFVGMAAHLHATSGNSQGAVTMPGMTASTPPAQPRRYTKLPALIRTEQLKEMSRLAEAHNRTFAGEIRQALDFYIAANRRAEQRNRHAPAGAG